MNKNIIILGDTVEIAKDIYQRWNGIMEKQIGQLNLDTVKSKLVKSGEEEVAEKFSWKYFLVPKVVLIE